MVDVSSYLDRKYDILGQTANSEQQLRSAQSRLLNSQADTNPGEAAAREAAGFGAAAASQGSANYLNTNASLAPAQSQSEIALRGAQAGGTEAQTVSTRAEQNFLPGYYGNIIDQNLKRGGGVGAPLYGSPGSSLQLPSLIPDLNRGTPGFSTGTSAVTPSAPTGPAPGPTDTVPAMLTPHEAVLNRGAVEHVGRHAIDVLNAIGTIKMNSAQQATETPAPATPVGYSNGTSRIEQMPGQSGGTWMGPDAIGTSGNTNIRQSLGLGAPRPTPAPKPAGTGATPPAGMAGYSDGTSSVGAPGDNLAQVASDMQKWSAFGEGNMAAAPKTKRDEAAKGPAGKPPASDNGKAMGAKGNDMPDAKGGETMAGYAKGTSNVGGKGRGAAPKGKPQAGAPPSNMPAPEAVQAIMQMQKAGKGMPQPGPGMSPLPMPMPQVAGQ